MSSICEGHLTFDKDQPADILKSAALALGYHYSFIDGWDETGPGGNQFLTSHGDAVSLSEEMDQIIYQLGIRGVKCKRKKIEALILDERFDV